MARLGLLVSASRRWERLFVLRPFLAEIARWAHVEKNRIEGKGAGVLSLTKGPSLPSVLAPLMLKVWDLETGALMCTFTCEGRVDCAAVVPDGRTCVAGDAADRVYVLRLENR